jgi:hypothetical protein
MDWMQGCEHAIFVNDVCGTPLPWLACAPWLYFDGKIFQMKLDAAMRGASLVQLCAANVGVCAQLLTSNPCYS